MRKIMVAAIGGMALATSLALAGESASSIEIGYVGTTGNTEGQTFSGLIKNEYKVDDTTEMKARADVLYGTNEGTKDKERYRVNYDLRHYYKGQDFYSYATTYYLRNHFEGYWHQYNLGAGGGYTFIRTPEQVLSLQAGPLVRRSWYLDPQPQFGEGAIINFIFSDVRLTYNYNFTKTNKLSAYVSYLQDYNHLSNYEIQGAVEMSLLIVDALSFNIRFEPKYAHMPAEGAEKLDTTTTAGVVYNF